VELSFYSGRQPMIDKQIEENVLWELDVDPQVRADNIIVDVEEGIVVLSGTVDSVEQRRGAERAAKRVYGVRAVADELALKRSWDGELPDTDLAREAVWALEVHNREIPVDRIQVTVCEGWVTLEGVVDSSHQKEAAEAAIGRLVGVRGITDQITVKSLTTPIRSDLTFEEAPRQETRAYSGLIPGETDEFWEIVRGSLNCWAVDEEAELVAP
jgi:osmotically-inducible protein OsmY